LKEKMKKEEEEEEEEKKEIPNGEQKIRRRTPRPATCVPEIPGDLFDMHKTKKELDKPGGKKKKKAMRQDLLITPSPFPPHASYCSYVYLSYTTLHTPCAYPLGPKGRAVKRTLGLAPGRLKTTNRRAPK
jgi:hypothetical protein